jgi:hypothetical protein
MKTISSRPQLYRESLAARWRKHFQRLDIEGVRMRASLGLLVSGRVIAMMLQSRKKQSLILSRMHCAKLVQGRE